MLLAGRLKRHTLPVILEFRVEPASLEANLFKLLHFVEEELDPPFLYIIVPGKTNLPQLFQTTATRSLMIRVLLFTERAFRRQRCTGRIVGVFLSLDGHCLENAYCVNSSKEPGSKQMALMAK